MYYRIQFAKTSAMRYTGHLDLHKAWERTLRRAQLPLAYSEGYNPRPRLTIASALPLGFTSEAEIIDIRLEEEIPVFEIAGKLDRSAPPGIQIQSILQLQGKPRPLQTMLESAEYILTFLDPVPELDARLDVLRNTVSLPRQRRGKTYDLRPLILHLERISDSPDSCPRLSITMSAREGATGRPDELVAAIGYDPHRVHIHRTRLNFEA